MNFISRALPSDSVVVRGVDVVVVDFDFFLFEDELCLREDEASLESSSNLEARLRDFNFKSLGPEAVITSVVVLGRLVVVVIGLSSSSFGLSVVTFFFFLESDFAEEPDRFSELWTPRVVDLSFFLSDLSDLMMIISGVLGIGVVVVETLVAELFTRDRRPKW